MESDRPLEADDFLDENGKWECIQCGACCADVSKILPQLVTSPCDTTCKYLQGNLMEGTATCRIYDRRPEVCRVDRKKLKDRQLADLCAKTFNKVWEGN